MKKTALLFAFLIVSTALSAQKPFEGCITYSYKILGDEAGALAGMIPSSMDVCANKKSTLVKVNGGMFASITGDIVSNAKETIMIKRDEKTYSVIPNPKEKSEDKSTVVKEDETLVIAGLTCQKYKVIKPTEQGETTLYVWLAKDYTLPQTNGKGAENMAVPGVPGIAMKTMVSQMGFTVVLTATDFKPGKQDKKQFTVPKDFTKKDFDAKGLGF